MKKKLLVLALFLLLTVCATACTVPIQREDPKVVSISVDGMTETTYVACDAIDLTDVTVTARYDDASVVTDIPVTKDMLDASSYDMNTPGEYKVRVVYGGASTTFGITVVAWDKTKVELASVPYVLNYVVGQQVKTAGATVKISFEGNKSKIFNVPEDWLLPYDRYAIGTKTITVSCYGEEMPFTVYYEDKTPIGITKVDDADTNYVFYGQSDNKYFDKTGMTVRISYDNAESPKYDAKKDLDEDLIVCIDASVPQGYKEEEIGDHAVEAVLLYLPDDYAETYTYRFFGTPIVGLNDIVKPGDKLASNSVTRTMSRLAVRSVTKNGVVTEEEYTETYEETIALDDILSKSFGTVVDLSVNDDGSRNMVVSVRVTYDVTQLFDYMGTSKLKVGDVVYDGTPIGRFGMTAVKIVGGGVVEEIENGKVTIKTAPTTTFKSNVKKKTCTGVEIITLPSPTKYTDTDINGMVEGDVLDKTTGFVRVNYNDGSSDVFRMDDEMITLVNSGASSLSDRFDLTPGRQKVLAVYVGGGELDEVGKPQHYDSFYVTVERKYPVELILDIDTVSNRTFYVGDTIQLSSMTYHIRYNNDLGDNEEIETMQVTLDMVDDGYSLYCAETKDNATLRFKLPRAYAALIPQRENGEEGDYIKPVCTYKVQYQPILAIEFAQKPVKVYVQDFEEVDYDGAKLDVYYRNNTKKTIAFGDTEMVSHIVSVDEAQWNDLASYAFNQGTNDTLYLFVKDGDTVAGSALDIVKGNYKGYEARAIYFDENGMMSGTTASFRYYLVAGLTVAGIKVSAVRGADGQELCKREYTQYEDWNFAGLEMTVTYSGAGASEIIDVLPEMVYDSNTNVTGEDIPVKFTYLGATDNSFTISVKNRVPEKITMVSRGATVYASTLSTSIKLSDYTFSLSYNAGPSDPVGGNKLASVGAREKSTGYWYSIYNSLGETPTSLLIPGTYFFRLHYSYPDESSPKGYSYISSMSKEDLMRGLAEGDPEAELYTFEVVERINEYFIRSVEYEQDVQAEGGVIYNRTASGQLNEETSIPSAFPATGSLPVLAEVAAGWEIMLSEYFDGLIYEKMLTLHCFDSALNAPYDEYVKITPEMLDYDVSDGTLGYRKVTITYKNFTTKVFVYVWNADLTDVNVEIIPLTNYVYTQIESEEDLDLDGGIVRLTFTKRTRQGVFAGYMNKYVDMSSEDVKYDGFIKGLYSKEGEKITINATYKNFDTEDLKTSYVITVYDRQDLTFGYSNIIFFYGNAAAAAAEPKQEIPEFTLPTDISLRYAQCKDMITIGQYLALSSGEQKNYVPVTTYDDLGRMVLSAFIPVNAGAIVSGNYIDPAAGSYYVKYGRVSLISEEDYARFRDDEKAQLTAIPTYDPYGRLTETFYTTTTEGLGDDAAQAKTRWYEGVIVDKISTEAYDADPSAYVGYERVDNEYYILMMVVDDRDEKVTDKDNKFNLRYYETTNYAFQRYTVIQKVVEVKVENGDATAKVLRLRARMRKGGQETSANPYVVYYLHNPRFNVLSGIKDAVKEEYGADYINSVYLASPNDDYFEIIVKFMDSYHEDTIQSKEIIAEVYYRAMLALTHTDFKDNVLAFTGVDLSDADLDVNFDFEGRSTAYDFNNNAGKKDQMKALIKEKWVNGVNVWINRMLNGVQRNERDELLAAIANGTSDYRVSYTMTFGDTKTRNGVLQLLGGQILFTSAYDAVQDKTVYGLESGTLAHSSYTVDLSKVTIEVTDDRVRIIN